MKKSKIVFGIEGQHSQTKIHVKGMNRPVELIHFDKLVFSKNSIQCCFKGSSKVLWIKDLKDGLKLHSLFMTLLMEGRTDIYIKDYQMVDLGKQVLVVGKAIKKMTGSIEEVRKALSSLNIQDRELQRLVHDSRLPKYLDLTVLAFTLGLKLGSPKGSTWDPFNYWKACIKKVDDTIQFNYNN